MAVWKTNDNGQLCIENPFKVICVVCQLKDMGLLSLNLFCGKLSIVPCNNVRP